MSGPPRSCRKCSRSLCVLSKPASKKWLHSKGSCIIYLGRTLHSGGENRSAQGIDRWGLNVDYNLGWLRQEVNQYLDVPPHVARTLPPQIQELIGYTMGGTALGYFDSGTDFASFPTAIFEERQEDVNWATAHLPEFAQEGEEEGASAWAAAGTLAPVGAAASRPRL